MKLCCSVLLVAAMGLGSAYCAETTTLALAESHFVADNTALAAANPVATIPTLAIAAAKGKIGMATTFTATLRNERTGAPLAGKQIHFSIDGVDVGVPMVTNAHGQAHYRFMVPEGMALGSHTLAAMFADGPASASTWLTVSRGPVRLKAVYASGHRGASVMLSAILTNGSNMPLRGATLTFHLPARMVNAMGGPMSGAALIFSVAGDPVGSATTDANGMASMPYGIPSRCGDGMYSMVVTFSGDASHLPATNAARLTVR